MPSLLDARGLTASAFMRWKRHNCFRVCVPHRCNGARIAAARTQRPQSIGQLSGVPLRRMYCSDSPSDSTRSWDHTLSRIPSVYLRDTAHGVFVHESSGCVSTSIKARLPIPRDTARFLRLSGRSRDAARVLASANANSSPNSEDLVELMRVVRDYNGKAGYAAEIGASVTNSSVVEMIHVINHSPARRTRTVCHLVLAQIAREASKIAESENASERREFLLAMAQNVWTAMTTRSLAEFQSRSSVLRYSVKDTDKKGGSYGLDALSWHSAGTSPPEPATAVLMFRIYGECAAAGMAEQVHAYFMSRCNRISGRRRQPSKAASYPTVECLAALILCLGKCKHIQGAKHVFYDIASPEMRKQDELRRSMFMSYVAAHNLAQADRLLDLYGPGFLNTDVCNAYVSRCSSLLLGDRADVFVTRMVKESDFPDPDIRTFNSLVEALCTKAGAELASVAFERVLERLDDMRSLQVMPNTVTYNMLLRNLIDQGRSEEALQVYSQMSDPNHHTFSHMMRLAAQNGDSTLAETVKTDLEVAKSIYGNYPFCRNLLEVTARAHGVAAAVRTARTMAIEYPEALDGFRDVGAREAVRMALIHACSTVGSLRDCFHCLKVNIAGSGDAQGRLAPMYIATALMQACLNAQSHGQALEVFYSMKRSGLQPNSEAYERLIYGLVSTRAGGGLVEVLPPAELDGARSESGDGHGEKCHSQKAEAIRSLASRHRIGLIVPVVSDSVSVKNDTIRAPGLEVDCREEDSGAADDVDSAKDVMKDDGKRPSLTLDFALQVLSDMHASGASRTSRAAVHVYNALIAAAGRANDLDLGLQLFVKMSLKSNLRAVYICNGTPPSRIARKDLMSIPNIFNPSFRFPEAVTTTYNSVIQAARAAGRPDISFRVFDSMDEDCMNEPSVMTLSLVADIVLAHTDLVPRDSLRKLVSRLAKVEVTSAELERKQRNLQKLALGLQPEGKIWEDRPGSKKEEPL